MTLKPQTAVSLQETFDALAAQWERETAHHSSLDIIEAHPAYQEIIGMGEAAVPLILRELERTPAWWFMALEQITGESPVQEKDWGKLQAITDAWLEWGRRKGLIA